MKIVGKTILAAIVILVLALYAFGQQAPAKQSPTKPAPSQSPAQAKNVPKYKPADEIKLKAVIEQIKNYECPVSGTMGTHLVLKLDSEKYEAHIGPQKFLEEFNIHLREGDTIILYGTKVKFGEETGILVRAIERENDQFFFRDKEGLPLWR